MEVTYWGFFLLINIILGSCKVLHPEVHEDVSSLQQPSARTFVTSDHTHEIHHHHWPNVDPNMGLWLLKNNIKAIETFEKALKQKLEADKKMNDHILHEELEKVLHPKKMPVSFVKVPPLPHPPPHHDHDYDHDEDSAPPPLPPQIVYDPYYGH